MVKRLREADRTSVAEVAKKHGIFEQPMYVWKRRFGGMGPVPSHLEFFERIDSPRSDWVSQVSEVSVPDLRTVSVEASRPER